MLPEGQKLFLIRGLSGSGKTHLGDKVAKAYDAVHWEADSFFYTDGEYKWDRTRVQDAHLWCNRQTAECLRFGDSVVVSNTFTQIWHLEPYIGMAMMVPDCRVFILEPNTPWARDPEECIKRNAHGIPRELVDAQAEIWEEYVSYGNFQVTEIKKNLDMVLFGEDTIYYKTAT